SADAEQLSYRTLDADADFAALYDLLYEQLMRSGRTVDAAQLLARKRTAFPTDIKVALQTCEHERRLHRIRSMDLCVDAAVKTASKLGDNSLYASDFYLRAGDFGKALSFYFAGEHSSPL